MIKYFLLILLTFAIIQSCSPIKYSDRVGSNTLNNKSYNQSSDEDIPTKNNHATTNQNKIDTVRVKLPDVTIEPNQYLSKDRAAKKPQKQNEFQYNTLADENESYNDEVINSELDDAISLYEDGQISKARNKFEALYSTINKDNPKFNEIRYYIAECDISENKIEKAKKDLLNLYFINYLKDNIREKVILRCGQLACYDKQKEKAQEFFDELRKNYPKSELNKIANCEFLKKK